MEKAKFIYILLDTDSYSDDLEDNIIIVTSDIAKIFNKIDYAKRFLYVDVLVAKCGENELCEINIDNDQLFREHPPYVYNTEEDKDEIEYVLACLTEWRKKRNDYLSEQKRIEEEERRQRKEENDRKEYERLKKKYAEGGTV